MRKLIFMAFLATAATPVLADPGDNDGRGRHGDKDRSSVSEQRPQRAAPAAARPEMNVPAPARGGWQQPPQGGEQQRVLRSGGAWQQQPQGGEQQRVMRSGGASFGSAVRSNGQTVDPAAMERWRERQERRSGGERPPVSGTTRWSDHTRSYGGTTQGWTRPVPGYTAPAPNGTRGGQAYVGHRSTGGWVDDRNGSWSHHDGRDGQRWSNNWRQDERYDWHRYRERNRFVFRIGNYYDPFGYDYQPFNIGFTLSSSYYQPRFWLDDPYQYRLPPVYGPFRWVRYYNDAVLVDIYTGEVEDVIRNFFW